jgi:hypothetical protein
MTVTVAPAAEYLRAAGTAPSHTFARFSALGLAASTVISERPDVAPVHHWDFGDGTTAVTADAATSHTYASPGTYRVQVTVTRDAAVGNWMIFEDAYAFSVASVRVGA